LLLFLIISLAGVSVFMSMGIMMMPQ